VEKTQYRKTNQTIRQEYTQSIYNSTMVIPKAQHRMGTLYPNNRLELHLALPQQQPNNSNGITSPKLNQMKAFRIKFLLNELPTHSHFYLIAPKTYQANTCFSCGNSDSPNHWISCISLPTPKQIIDTSTNQIVNKHLRDLAPTQRSAIVDLIKSHPSFNYSPTLSPQIHQLPSTLKGLISSPLLQLLQALDLQYKESSDIIIQTLLLTSAEIYEQIWKPYCDRFAKWKKQHNIASHNKAMATQAHTHTKRQRIKYTYSCPCGIADQQHEDNSTCPPKGQAQLKFEQWSTAWIQYSIHTNYILTIKT